MIDGDALRTLLGTYLPRQRWFSGDSADAVVVRSVDVLADEGWPAMVDVVAETGGGPYQVLVGLRPPDSHEAFFEGKPEAVLGELDTDRGRALAFDATIDGELSLALLRHVAPEEEASRARLLMIEQSNTSVVFDERLVLKLFRRLVEGPNPDAEVPRALVAAGFTNVAPPVAAWTVDGVDRAVVSRYLSGGSDGFALALTSLRDLFDYRGDPGDAGGDFAPDARRLGIITAKMHLAMVAAFGAGPGSPDEWADAMEAQLDGAGAAIDGLAAVVRARYRRLRQVSDAGPSVRVHGDYHLGQVMRTDEGWFVLDFEGEPTRPVEERRRPSSPMRDVAGMARSFDYAASVALREWGTDADEQVVALARAWESRNSFAFLEGYMATDGVEALLPPDPGALDVVRSAFELDKAIYELCYETGHRPDWVWIPRAAVERLLAGADAG